MRPFLLFLLVLLITVSAGIPSFAQSKKKVEQRSVGIVKVIIEPVFNGKPLVLDSGVYVNDHGDTLSISVFKFYITVSNYFKIGKGLGTTVITEDHLFNAEDTASWSFSSYWPYLNDSISNMLIVVGVDSVHNTNGANAGDLDPVKGMYWAWNTGYIMAKIEGTSKVCHTLHNVFEFHIGGYMPPFNTERQAKLYYPVPIHIGSGKIVTIKIKADVAAWFSGGLDLSKTNSILIPGKEAADMADRYSKMFSVGEVSQ